MRLFVILIILHLPYSSSAQSLIREFHKISCAEKVWVITHPFKAKKAFRITSFVRLETAKVKQEQVLDTFPHGGKLDAFRHCYWMATLTQKIGRRAAFSLGKAHERGNYRAFRKSKKEDGEIQDATAVEMDVFNNQQGICIGINNPKTEPYQVRMIVIETIKKGELKTLKRSANGMLTDCFGAAVDISNRTKKDWKLPYCLISSNE